MAAVLSPAMGGQMSTPSGAKFLLSAIRYQITSNNFFFFHPILAEGEWEKWREDGKGSC